jgi:SAM domain (Sterile alpha motif)
MEDIASWLKTLGLEQYAACFAKNDISFAILPDLTDQDLKEIGVSSLGHRRQLLRAMVECSQAAKSARTVTAPSYQQTSHVDAAERRAPLDWRTMTHHKRSSTSSMRCSRRSCPRLRMSRSSLRCCRSRMMDAISRWNWLPSSAGKERWRWANLKSTR